MNAERSETRQAGRPSNPPHGERLAALGGQYARSRTADRSTEREQARVDHAREVAECKAEGGHPF